MICFSQAPRAIRWAAHGRLKAGDNIAQGSALGKDQKNQGGGWAPAQPEVIAR